MVFSRKHMFWQSIKMAECLMDMMDCLIDCFCSICLRTWKYDFIEPKEVEWCGEEEQPDDPDYIPLYLEITQTGHTYKYTNMAP